MFCNYFLFTFYKNIVFELITNLANLYNFFACSKLSHLCFSVIFDYFGNRMCLDRMWKISWKVISWQRIALKHCGSLDHILMILLRLRLWPYLALRLTKSWSQWWVWRIRPKIMTSTAMMERSSRWAKRAAGRKTRTASRLSAGFPKLQFWFQRNGTWKKCSSKLIHGMMKNANVYRKEGWETGKYRMYRNVS